MAPRKRQVGSKAKPSTNSRVSRESLEKQGVRYCFSSFVDAHGVAKGKAVPIDHFDRMMRGSELFTGAALDGLGQGPHDDELAVHPEPGAIVQLPWQPEVAWAPGFLKYHGEPWPMCSRTVLQRQIDRAAKLGLQFNLGIECEVYIVRRNGSRIEPNNPFDNVPKAAYDVQLTLENYGFLDECVSAMNALGWEVHSFDHEDANGQFEFDFAYADVMTMADRFVLWRLMMKEIARKYGWEATFMPKPYANRTGSGAHFNMSLSDTKTGRNVCGDAKDPRGCGISKIGYQFLGGIKKHAAAAVAVTCPTVNSYKRLIKSGSMTGYTWAPVFISYGNNNRTHMLRIPKLRPEIEGKASAHHGVYLSAARLECRAVDPCVNPYVGAAMVLAAGLDGIEKNLDPGDPIELNMYELSQKDLDKMGVKSLPSTLLHAIEAFAADPLSRDVMGDDLYRSYIDLKTKEWWNYHNAISEWEIDNYLTKY
jgi:glutamine synthetase